LPAALNLYLDYDLTDWIIDWIMERVASRTGFSLGNDHFTDLDYADDVVLLAHKNG